MLIPIELNYLQRNSICTIFFCLFDLFLMQLWINLIKFTKNHSRMSAVATLHTLFSCLFPLTSLLAGRLVCLEKSKQWRSNSLFHQTFAIQCNLNSFSSHSNDAISFISDFRCVFEHFECFSINFHAVNKISFSPYSSFVHIRVKFEQSKNWIWLSIKFWCSKIRYRFAKILFN